jgi:hypothetical protein
VNAQDGRLNPTEYAELIARVHATAAVALPAGASVLVVSKGDAALAQIPGVAAQHFPQDASSGNYAGHHPADSAQAVAQLQDLQRRGARYLVIPATSLWWLDFYAELAEHLAANAALVADEPGACRIFDLGQRPLAEAVAALDAEPPLSLAQMRDYLENLLSLDSRAVVLETGGGALAGALAPLAVAGVAGEDLRHSPEQALVRLAEAGAEYLVVPRCAEDWLRRHAEVAGVLETRCRKIADQRYLCRVFELRGLWARA